jgi:type II secretory pathway pseudopilin PulG
MQSSRAAIDLASIMVGVIIIGLIGGVIAATVFAVIPWSQDKAAKQQLESVHAAQNVFFGLSSDPSQDLVGGKKNSFANSAELASNNLLISNANYCTIPTADGQDYRAYTKSGSGKTFFSLNSNKQAQETAVFPCITDANGVVIVDPTRDNGTTPVGTAPGTTTPGTGGGTTPTPTPTPTPTTPPSFAFYGFETTGTPTAFSSSSTTSSSTVKPYSGLRSARVSIANVNAQNYGITQNTPMVTGTVYVASAWVYINDSSIEKASIMHGTDIVGTVSTIGKMGQWVQVTSTFTAKAPSVSVIGVKNGTPDSTSGAFIYIDDLTINTK